MMGATLDPVDFFVKHAPFSWDPQTETPAQGMRRCAELLADAEMIGARAGLMFDWSIDPDIDSSEFSDVRPAWQLWECRALLPTAPGHEPVLVAALGGVDFGPDGHPNRDPYRRVVQAELALEAINSGALT